MTIHTVVKRDDTRVPFDRKRIENAIYAAAKAVGNGESRKAAVERWEQRGHSLVRAIHPSAIVSLQFLVPPQPEHGHLPTLPSTNHQ